MKTSLLIVLFLVVPSVALAQTPSAPVAVTAFSPTQITISVLAFVVALAVSAYNSGKIFGFATVPQPVLPYLGVGIPFLSAIYKSLSAVSPITGIAVWNAIMAGLFALISSAVGAGVHVTLQKHFAQPYLTKAAQKAAKVVSMAAMALFLSQASCVKVPPTVVPPTAACVDAVIVDALSGMNVDQIVVKEAPGCGIDAAQVIAILLDVNNAGYQKNGVALTATQAYAQAQARQAATEQEKKPQ